MTYDFVIYGVEERRELAKWLAERNIKFQACIPSKDYDVKGDYKAHFKVVLDDASALPALTEKVNELTFRDLWPL